MSRVHTQLKSRIPPDTYIPNPYTQNPEAQALKSDPETLTPKPQTLNNLP